MAISAADVVAVADRRFWPNVQKTDSCWLWTSASYGGPPRYGKAALGHGTYTGAHRFSWMLHYGPIPDGLFVCHRCDVSLCVRADHLFLGTALDNNRDCKEKGRRASKVGSRHHLAQLTEEIVLEIRRRAAAERSVSLAEEFRVSKQTICDILARRTWAHV